MGGKNIRILTGAIVLASILCGGAIADPLFYDDFESDLSAWTGKYGGAHNGLIVADPLDPGNHVLTFRALNSAGDIFTAGEAFHLVSGREYTVSFDYLGPVNQVPGGSGGFAGLSQGFPGTHFWYYGTNTTSGAAPVMVDDGQWHRYTYDFTAPTRIGSDIHLMFEDFRYSGASQARDAFFDNVSLAPVPLPGAVLLASFGLGVSGWICRRIEW